MSTLEHTVRIGVFGGAFNPPHLGHFIVAQDALEYFELDRMFFLPSATPPHKSVEDPMAARHRVAMLEAVLEDDERMELCMLEIERGGISYSIDTLRELHHRYPHASFWFLIGADLVPGLREWRDIHNLCSLCRFAVCARPGFSLGERPPDHWGLTREAADRLEEDFFSGRQIEISSSEIRRRVAEGQRIRYLVPPFVEMYIAEHRLYLA